jgi:hypothetical protein
LRDPKTVREQSSERDCLGSSEMETINHGEKESTREERERKGKKRFKKRLFKETTRKNKMRMVLIYLK